MTLKNEEFNLLNKIARINKCDWFSIRQCRGNDYTYDLCENRSYSLSSGVKDLCESIVDFDILNDSEKVTLLKLLISL